MSVIGLRYFVEEMMAYPLRGTALRLVLQTCQASAPEFSHARSTYPLFGPLVVLGISGLLSSY